MMRAALRIPPRDPHGDDDDHTKHESATDDRRVDGWLLVLVASALYAIDRASRPRPRRRRSRRPRTPRAALVQAVKANDKAGLRAVLGNDRATCRRAIPWPIAPDARELRRRVRREARARRASGDAMTLTIGNDDFPFAFPLVKTGDRWRFDTAAGKDELLARRIGENELDAIKVLQAIVDAQREYASADRDGDGVPRLRAGNS